MMKEICKIKEFNRIVPYIALNRVLKRKVWRKSIHRSLHSIIVEKTG